MVGRRKKKKKKKKKMYRKMALDGICGMESK
jgi:hypothetical protein